MADTIASPADWRDIKQVAAARPAFTQRRLRHLIDRAHPHYNASGDLIPGNGLAEAIAKVSSRPDRRFGIVLIDLVAFDRWIESQRLKTTTVVEPTLPLARTRTPRGTFAQADAAA